MSRATILVGHSDFGRDVLQRLLTSAAPRGVLSWTRRPQGGPGAGERQLRDLALLWLPDRPGLAGVPDQHLPDPAAVGTDTEFFRDLYRQILKVAPEGESATPEQALGAAVDEAKRALLSPQARRERPGQEGAVHGLDLIVLARPGTAAALGQIDNLLRAALRPLWDDPTLRRVGSEAQVVNCIAVLDFDDFWARNEDARRLRRALINSARTWESAGRDRPGPGRIYLMDSKTAGAQRDRDARLDEATLFLEFLLFEGKRADFDWLYRQPSHGQPPLAAFGIRLLERSPALLGQIAAARFGQEWLPYLAGDKSPRPRATRVRAALAPLRQVSTPTPGVEDPLVKCWRIGVDRLVNAILTLSNQETPDWAERAGLRFRQGCRELELDLARTIDQVVLDLRKRHLQQGDKVRQAIIDDLHDEREPVPLASVQEEIKAAVTDLIKAQVAAHRPRGSDGPVGLDDLHRRFLSQSREWIGRQGRALTPFWLLFGALLGLGLAPFAQAFLLSLPEPDPLAQTRHWLHQASQWLAEPAPLALVLGALAATLLNLLLGRGVHRRIARARDLYLDPAAGRFAAVIRAQDDPLTIYLEQARADLTATLAGEALQFLGQLGERLAQRRRELGWLREQLGGFLRLHGQHPDPLGVQGKPRRPQLSVRQWVEAPGDLERMLQTNPLTEERWRAYQADLPEPFQGWDERAARDAAKELHQDPGPCRGWAGHYCDAFLDPLKFVALLSQGYVRPFKAALAASDSTEQQLRQTAITDLLKRPDFSLAFAFAPAADTPVSRRCCVMPSSWKQGTKVDGVSNIYEGKDDTRVYLFEVVTGVPTTGLGD
ncbi:hypothetical protein [Lamprocystis purpurea]|jgi:hypothetical protein|uniref:hypothetical protein n=1 Tax=Lamprocystis purpurea TaxID=61598 RepID=UPI00038149F4|nr:hypothetical protein [Lamprocystis purpurea]